MRDLKAKDLAPFIKILAAMELREALKGMFSEDRSRGAMIAELIAAVLENYEKADQALIAFIAELNGATPEETADLPMGDFIGAIQELFSEKNLPFFKSAVS